MRADEEIAIVDLARPRDAVRFTCRICGWQPKWASDYSGDLSLSMLLLGISNFSEIAGHAMDHCFPRHG